MATITLEQPALPLVTYIIYLFCPLPIIESPSSDSFLKAGTKRALWIRKQGLLQKKPKNKKTYSLYRSVIGGTRNSLPNWDIGKFFLISNLKKKSKKKKKFRCHSWWERDWFQGQKVSVITYTAIANGILLCIFVYYRLEGSKLLPPCQSIIIFQEKAIYLLKGSIHLLTFLIAPLCLWLLDCLPTMKWVFPLSPTWNEFEVECKAEEVWSDSSQRLGLPRAGDSQHHRQSVFSASLA